MILPCTCRHSAQDRLHGEGQRVHNRAPKEDIAERRAYRCTVCATINRKGGQVAKPKDSK